MAAVVLERNQDASVYVGGLDEKVSEAVLWELFVQAGPVASVNMPKDRVTGTHQGFGFVEFMSEEDADYAIKIMNMIKLFGKPIKVNKASANEKNIDVGANLFVGNLDAEVDEKLLFDTFSAFGMVLQVPKIMRDPESGNSKGYAFVNFASFEASDLALEAMNGQYLCNRAITCSYAFKKDAKGERHGTAAERLLAAQNPLFQQDRPNQIFADMPGAQKNNMPPPPTIQQIQFQQMGMQFQGMVPGMPPMAMQHNMQMPPFGMPAPQSFVPPPPMSMPPTAFGMGIPPPPSMIPGPPVPSSFGLQSGIAIPPPPPVS